EIIISVGDILPQYPPLVLKAAKTVKPSPNSALSLKTENHRNTHTLGTNPKAIKARVLKTHNHAINHQKHIAKAFHTFLSEMGMAERRGFTGGEVRKVGTPKRLIWTPGVGRGGVCGTGDKGNA
ncbi:hypothetical protein PIB30_050304, partial [Stylosanthes scabra]|nr:hypothetical protein [Stylosanthes scabra]